MIRLLIVDDHPIFRQGLIRTISTTSDLIVAGEANNGSDALEKISANDFHVVLLDISMPGQNCFDIIREIRKLKPKLPILIVTMHPEGQYALRMFKLGISGYLTKERAPIELLEAIRIVAGGQKYIPQTIVEQAIGYVEDGSEKPPHETLSNREYEVLSLMLAGKKVGEIAEILSISVKTVKTHRARLLTKMNIKTNAELFRYAIKHNLVNEP
jgi:two-component system invasion response regulator UvrY